MAENETTELQTRINTLPLASEQKVFLLNNLPTMGKHVVAFLNVATGGSDFARQPLTYFGAVSGMIKALDSLRKGDEIPVVELLKLAPGSPDYGFGKLVVPLVMELRHEIKFRSLSQSEQVLGAILEFEARAFQYLPVNELLYVVEHHLVFFVRRLNFLMEFKRIYLPVSHVVDWFWGEKFVKAIMRNEELFGAVAFVRDGKSEKPTIGNWIEDYIGISPKKVSDRGVYDQIQYLETSQNARTLGELEQAALLEILKLYQWFMYPIVTESEVEEYEKTLDSEQLDGQKNPSPVLNIDKKLEDLRSKVSNNVNSSI